MLRAIKARFAVGEVEPHHRIEALHVWQVSGASNVFGVLNSVLPFLTTKADAARSTLDHIAATKARRDARADRDRQILALADLNEVPYRQIAEMLNIEEHTIRGVVKRNRARQNPTQ
jgi:hypothetical protein